MVTIREVQEKDAEAFLALRAAIDAETDFMAYGEGQRSRDVEKMRERIVSMQQGNGVMFLAEDDGRLVGYVGAWREASPRRDHSAHIAVGILKAYWGRGIGTKFFQAVELWARSHDLHRLELEVMTTNERAIALYTNMGFVREGTKRHAICIEGEYVDNIVMAKLLGE